LGSLSLKEKLRVLLHLKLHEACPTGTDALNVLIKQLKSTKTPPVRQASLLRFMNSVLAQNKLQIDRAPRLLESMRSKGWVSVQSNRVHYSLQNPSEVNHRPPESSSAR
jgi:hypothetical protein